MRFSSVCAALALLSSSACSTALRPAENGGDVLPLHAVRLYENGVGYFEREGVLSSRSGSTLGVPASHVDDALKTLIVLSKGHARVSGIEFRSVVSDGAARSLAGLPLEGESPADYEHVLRSLVGFRVEIAGESGAPLRGRLLDVERDEPARVADKAAPKPAPAAPVFSLLLVADDGALSRLSSGAIRTIRPLDRAFSARLQTAADALGGRSAQLRRELRVRASASAPVRIGYIAETPIWRASYRLVLSAEPSQGVLQGWALVHNDTDEAWTDVDIELVNGTPDSFLFPMAAPRYGRRPLDTPETELSTVPQLALKTADGLWGDHVDDSAGEGGLGLSGVGEGGGGYGEGIGLGSIGTVGHGSGSGSAESGIRIGDLSELASAKGKDEGRLFSYHLAEKVSLGAHGSSLLPMLEHAVAARRFTRFDGSGTGRAAVRFVNDSPYILPAGPVAVFEPAGFSGETLVERLRPSDRVFLEYGVDLDATLAVEKKDVSTELVHVSFAAKTGRLRQDEVRVSEQRLDIENHAAAARAVGYVLSGVVTNAKVEGADELDYDAKNGAAIAFVTAPSRATLKRTLRITEARASTTALETLTKASVEALATTVSLPAAERAILRAALPRVAALEAAEQAVHELERRNGELDTDLTRNQEHLAAASSGEGGANPIATRIVSLERARDAGHARLASLRDGLPALKEAVTHVLEGLPPLATSS